jgi:DNA helicase-2/ATP-dependent DNA helicase PcrA
MTVAAWAERPAEDAENPLLAEADEAEWPTTPAGQHYAAVREAASLVHAAGIAGAEEAADKARADELTPGPLAPDQLAPGQLSPDQPIPDQLAPGQLTEQERELAAAWELDAGLLLAERGRQRDRGDGPVEVLLPDRLSVSALVALARDPDELARQVRRPMPQPPARQARRGTAFHLWLEERFGQQRLIDDDELFADADDQDQDENLIELKARFEAGEWGGRWPRETEVPFDMLIGDRQVRGRIDAVFADPDDGSFDVVDWKTGQPPRGKAEKDAVAVQLAAYRLAWSALADVPLGGVRAAFYYVRHDRTVRPADLLDGAGLVALISAVPVTA